MKYNEVLVKYNEVLVKHLYIRMSCHYFFQDYEVIVKTVDENELL